MRRRASGTAGEPRTLEIRRPCLPGPRPEKSRHRLCGARARGHAAALPGGVGAPPAWPLRAGCEELADVRRTSSVNVTPHCKARPDAASAPRGRRRPSPQMSPGICLSGWRAERRRVSAVESAQTAQAKPTGTCTEGLVAPRGAPSPSLLRKRGNPRRQTRGKKPREN
jgi:hypothetical protein